LLSQFRSKAASFLWPLYSIGQQSQQRWAAARLKSQHELSAG
jgi:hypothetical protein